MGEFPLLQLGSIGIPRMSDQTLTQKGLELFLSADQRLKHTIFKPHTGACLAY
jgi:hypothetical protein